MQGINVTAFFEELEKIGATQVRSPDSTWAPETIGAPRSKLPGAQSPKAPTVPGQLSSKLVRPAGQYGQRTNYTQSNEESAPSVNPMQGEQQRNTPPPNVVFGVR